VNTAEPARVDVNRGRRQFVMLVAVFVLPMLAAILLALSGWRPVATRNHGTLVEPAQDFRAERAVLASGEPVVWNSADGIWHIVVRAPSGCGAPCARMVDSLQRVWIGLGSDAAHAAVLWTGDVDAATRDALTRFPQARVATLDTALLPPATPPVAGDALAPLGVWLVDPNGYLVMRYDAGFDPIGLRADLRKLIR
jgi:cytochrome oxidase Cu insertion factor (SCO1/SenC/PrrC family)